MLTFMRMLAPALLLLSAIFLIILASPLMDRLVFRWPSLTNVAFVMAAFTLWVPIRTPRYRRTAIFFATLWIVCLLIPLACTALSNLSPRLFPDVLDNVIFGPPQVLYFAHAVFLLPPRLEQSVLSGLVDPVVSVVTWSVLAILFGYVTRRVRNTWLLVGSALILIVASFVGIQAFVRVIGGTMSFDAP
jgi:uncharacterized membrane protein